MRAASRATSVPRPPQQSESRRSREGNRSTSESARHEAHQPANASVPSVSRVQTRGRSDLRRSGVTKPAAGRRMTPPIGSPLRPRERSSQSDLGRRNSTIPYEVAASLPWLELASWRAALAWLHASEWLSETTGPCVRHSSSPGPPRARHAQPGIEHGHSMSACTAASYQRPLLYSHHRALSRSSFLSRTACQPWAQRSTWRWNQPPKDNRAECLLDSTSVGEDTTLHLSPKWIASSEYLLFLLAF